MHVLRIGISLVFAAALIPSGMLACKDDGPALPADDEPAGVVVEAVGSVTIEGVPGRMLVAGDRVKGADVIVTGPASRVTIQLFHNHAEWGMGPDRRRRVSESAAWRLPRDTSRPLFAGTANRDETSAAGRHAERDTADTRATALPAEPGVDREGGAVAQDAEELPSGAPEQKALEVARDERADEGPGDDRSPDRDGKASLAARAVGESEGAPAPGAPAPDPAESTGLSLDPAEADGAAVGAAETPAGKHDRLSRARAARKPASDPPERETGASRSAGVRLTMGKTTATGGAKAGAIRSAIAARLDAITRCVGKGPSRAVDLAIQIEVDARGKVSKVRATSADSGLAGCADRALSKPRLPDIAVDRAVTVTQRLRWTPR